MGDRDGPRRWADVQEIQKLKARYFRFMDTKQWERFGELFTEDLKFYIEGSPTAGSDQPAFDGRRDLVGYLAASHPAKVTVHQGHMPEIEFTGDDTATGVWAVFDWVDDPGRGGAWQGFGHYHERYVRGPDRRWRICEVRLTRLRVDRVEPRVPLGDVGIDPVQMTRARAEEGRP
ncbi:MAG TPA: nuclear transport factor 2 family protein [Acidimicrobiales bacterium]|nr:nuclear transport factor 2 family protein [Acidimicrobiales bacterium]